jgi:hypothetical protein
MIREGDVFDEYYYPNMMNELVALKEAIAHLPSSSRAEIIISYLRGHSINNSFIDDNPKLVAVITSNMHPTHHIEGLFESCKQNKTFLKSYEEYLRASLQNSTVTF